MKARRHYGPGHKFVPGEKDRCEVCKDSWDNDQHVIGPPTHAERQRVRRVIGREMTDDH